MQVGSKFSASNEIQAKISGLASGLFIWLCVKKIASGQASEDMNSIVYCSETVLVAGFIVTNVSTPENIRNRYEILLNTFLVDYFLFSFI